MTKVKTDPAPAPEAAAPAEAVASAPTPPADAAPAAASADPASDTPEAAKPYDEAGIRDILKRLKLPKAWIDPNGKPAFDEKHLVHTYGQEVVDTLTVISAE